MPKKRTKKRPTKRTRKAPVKLQRVRGLDRQRTIQVRVNDQERAKLHKLAEKDDQSLSDYIRQRLLVSA